VEERLEKKIGGREVGNFSFGSVFLLNFRLHIPRLMDSMKKESMRYVR